jgi:hypothetical protein
VPKDLSRVCEKNQNPYTQKPFCISANVPVIRTNHKKLGLCTASQSAIKQIYIFREKRIGINYHNAFFPGHGSDRMFVKRCTNLGGNNERLAADFCTVRPEKRTPKFLC